MNVEKSLSPGVNHLTLISEPEIPESEFYFPQLIQALPAAIYTCDIRGYIQFYNKAAATLWGREPVIGRDLWCGSWKIFTLDGKPVSLDDCPMAVTLKEGRPVRGVEIVIERPDGMKVNVLPHPDPIFDKTGRLVGAVNMLVDITEHKKTKEINNLLQRYNEQLEQFAYAASHDMQEPLRKIHTFSNMLMERNAGQLDESGKNYLSKIIQSTDRMSSVINDLLDFSNASKSYEEMSAVDLNEVMEKVKTDLELIISDKEAAITYDNLPVVTGIPSQINRLFYNLINNALKFSNPGVSPAIHISAVCHSSSVEILVKDNGIGFEPKYATKIFGLFQRLNDRYSYNGNGIGLALCKKIVENHNGNIHAESTPGEGASFYIDLPVKAL